MDRGRDGGREKGREGGSYRESAEAETVGRDACQPQNKVRVGEDELVVASMGTGTRSSGLGG